MTHSTTLLTDRALLAVSGEERFSFLNTLLSADVSDMVGEARFAALLTPQGKLLADVICFTAEDRVLIDFPADSDFAKRLRMYKLRADVTLELLTDWSVVANAEMAEISFQDPRDPSLGQRSYTTTPPAPSSRSTYDAARIAAVVPEGARDLEPNKALLLESGFERLGGLDFRKGCYVGQEVTARMKYRNLGKKRLMAVQSTDDLASGDAIMAGERTAGMVTTAVGTKAIALMRHEFIDADLSVESGAVEIFSDPDAP